MQEQLTQAQSAYEQAVENEENTNKQNSNSIDNASDSVEDTGKWEKINRFELKSAPVAYLKIEPQEIWWKYIHRTIIMDIAV